MLLLERAFGRQFEGEESMSSGFYFLFALCDSQNVPHLGISQRCFALKGMIQVEVMSLRFTIHNDKPCKQTL